MGIFIVIFLFVLLVMCTKTEVSRDEAVSRVYGLAYWKTTEQMCVCYPIPFNIAAHFIHRLWWILRCPKFIANDVLSKPQETHDA